MEALNGVQAMLPTRLRMARWKQALGVWGLLGVALCVAAAALGLVVVSNRGELRKLQATRAAIPGVEPPAPSLSAAPGRVTLLRRGDVPMVLTRLEREATEGGLPWSAAEYRLMPANDKQTAWLEVRCAFKAPYPAVRAVIGAWLGSVPGMSFREMSFTRPSIDTPDVDARFTIVVFLAEDVESRSVR